MANNQVDPTSVDNDVCIKTAAVLAAYVDQSISTDTFYNPAHFRSAQPELDRKIPITLIAKNLMLGHKWGIKTFYYSLINKAGSKEKDTDIPLEQEDYQDEVCEACTL